METRDREVPSPLAPLLEAHRSRPGALLPLLHAVQEAVGYVPPAWVPFIAEALDLSRAEVHGVIRFYPHFRQTPPGAHRLVLCRGESCLARGAEELIAQAERLLGVFLGGDTPDGRFSLEGVYCLGLCGCSPAAMLDGQVQGRLTPRGLEAFLAAAQERS
ncbi:MAG: NAD(P)H-dependent oxidoreductase subunit E [Rhodocyclales bacterium]|nr:NAD(P)H-dependent oxidoreductase subunit E [Rhodocyclales bacterium]